MPLSKQSVGTLIDLVENKMSSMQVVDRDDLQELNLLEHCLSELNKLLNNAAEGLGESLQSVPRRGRRRKSILGMGQQAIIRPTALRAESGDSA